MLFLKVDKIVVMSRHWTAWKSSVNLLAMAGGLKVIRRFDTSDYSGQLLSNKEGKKAFEASKDQSMQYMFTFRPRTSPDQTVSLTRMPRQC